MKPPPVRLLVHGGAGPIPRGSPTTEREAEFRAGLSDALRCGHEVLMQGGSALDAVTEAVAALEDCPLFNAGRGSVLNEDGDIEMDAALMCGHSTRAGAVACLRGVRHPVRVARRVMEVSPHVLLAGPGADRFARDQGFEPVPTADLVVPHRLAQWQALKGSGVLTLDHDDRKFGTVGAVARDQQGHLAAATSTGGIVNKRWGRVGDTPLVGAGTYADDATVAVSMTGQGEAIMRAVAAHRLAAAVELAGATIEQAAEQALSRVAQAGGQAGLIAVDRRGQMCMAMNTEGMFRGWLDDDGEMHTAIF
jgi:beta-aspartyl-peptidase (threonine type)